MHSRERHRNISREALNGGDSCQGAPLAVVECNIGPCPVEPKVNCTWTEWGDWSTCSRSCDGGFRERHRNISQKGPSINEIMQIFYIFGPPPHLSLSHSRNLSPLWTTPLPALMCYVIYVWSQRLLMVESYVREQPQPSPLATMGPALQLTAPTWSGHPGACALSRAEMGPR